MNTFFRSRMIFFKIEFCFRVDEQFHVVCQALKSPAIHNLHQWESFKWINRSFKLDKSELWLELMFGQ